ncbi:MAG: hypothetical protein ACD_9C00040G0001 [uncultured bacterium]|nr:MAG: hypothetical protein ACD_9C00040G0001 [uncultured bacterium]
MTKFILHGGNSDRKTIDNDKFFLEVANSANKEKVNILCIYFARPEHRWDDSFQEDKLAFLNLEIGKSFDIEMASLDTGIFRTQINWADIVYIQGGRKGCLKEKLLELENFQELIQNKVVVGISAGANILAKYYYSNVANEIREGLGVLPIKTFCHYNEENALEIEKLESYKEKLPICRIPEEKYMIFEI